MVEGLDAQSLLVRDRVRFRARVRVRDRVGVVARVGVRVRVWVMARVRVEGLDAQSLLEERHGLRVAPRLLGVRLALGLALGLG